MTTRSVLQIAAVSMLISGCSSGPPPIKPGSPAFFWAVARESYRTGDLLKTQATLLELGKSDNEFAERARVAHLVISAGVMNGLGDLADAYQSGSRVSPTQFRREASTLRGMAASAALEFAQAAYEWQGEKPAVVRFAFGFPPGNSAPPPELRTIANGVWPTDTERESVERAALQHEVVLAVSRAVGEPDEPARARALFQGPEVQVPKETFFLALAKLLYDGSDLFGPKRLDRPERETLMCREALEVLRLIPETNQTKALSEQIQGALKKIPGV